MDDSKQQFSKSNRSFCSIRNLCCSKCFSSEAAKLETVDHTNPEARDATGSTSKELADSSSSQVMAVTSMKETTTTYIPKAYSHKLLLGYNSEGLPLSNLHDDFILESPNWKVLLPNDQQGSDEKNGSPRILLQRDSLARYDLWSREPPRTSVRRRSTFFRMQSEMSPTQRASEKSPRTTAFLTPEKSPRTTAFLTPEKSPKQTVVVNPFPTTVDEAPVLNTRRETVNKTTITSSSSSVSNKKVKENGVVQLFSPDDNSNLPPVD